MNRFIWLILLIPTLSFASDLYPWDWLDNQEFSAAYTKALQDVPTSLNTENDWYKKLNGTGMPSQVAKIGDVSWDMIFICKPHECADHYAKIMYNTKNNQLYALVLDQGEQFYLGKPNQEIQQALELTEPE